MALLQTQGESLCFQSFLDLSITMDCRQKDAFYEENSERGKRERESAISQPHSPNFDFVDIVGWLQEPHKLPGGSDEGHPWDHPGELLSHWLEQGILHFDQGEACLWALVPMNP